MRTRAGAVLAAGILLGACSPEVAATTQLRVDVASCQVNPTLGDSVTMPVDIVPTALKTLPIDDTHETGFSMRLYEVAAARGEVAQLSVFWFTPATPGPLLIRGQTVNQIDSTTGPAGIHGVDISEGDNTAISVMSRDLVPEALADWVTKAALNVAGELTVNGGPATPPLASLTPSDIPGIGSIPVSTARTGFVRSFTDNATRQPYADQRAVVVSQTCTNTQDVGRSLAIAWWYGIGPVKRNVDGLSVSTFSYDAPAGNGVTTLQLWEDRARTTIVGTFGLSAGETTRILDDFGSEITQ